MRTVTRPLNPTLHTTWKMTSMDASQRAELKTCDDTIAEGHLTRALIALVYTCVARTQS